MKIIGITASVERRVSCRELFNKLYILPLASEFLLSFLFQKNSDIYNINTSINMTSIGQMLTSLVIRKMLTMQGSNYSVLFQLTLEV
jgi:hypothetical protein